MSRLRSNVNAAGGKVEGLRRREREEAGDDDPSDRHENDHEHDDREPANLLDVAPEERRHRNAHHGGRQVMRERRHAGPHETQVVGKADRAASHRQRRDENGLEDEQKAHQPAETEGLERLPEVQISPTAPGQRGAELRVHQAVGEREHEPRQPRVEHVRAVHGRDHERNGQEGPDAHHADHVGGRRFEQAHGPAQCRRRGGGRCRS